MNLDFLKPQLKIQKHKLAIYQKIGEGAFAFVYKVKLLSNTGSTFSSTFRTSFENNNSQYFAVKKMICQTEEHVDLAAKEIRVMMEIQHPNVIPLLGNSNLFYILVIALKYIWL